MKILKYLIIFAILSVVIIVAGSLYFWIGKDVVPFKVPVIIPDLKIEGVRLTRAVAGQTEWELSAKSADYYREKGVTHLELPEVVFYTRGDGRIRLTGVKGEVFNATNDVVISGDVKIVTTDGYIFQSDYLRYLSGKKMVTTESKVFLKGTGMNIEGVGLSADIERDRVFIKRDIKAILEGNIQ